ncbi:dynein axonemal intermediate chain 3 [Gracilinanus agilis]|uniref:dynein axonemal intermediate chain 3 n=1 Tax=Gracilinanus agilis TaxID=191870 RepID=UPI001CFEC5B3|nr:dynein axonemal intermediate chain 3 [Gracilinanus agilis]
MSCKSRLPESRDSTHLYSFLPTCSAGFSKTIQHKPTIATTTTDLVVEHSPSTLLNRAESTESKGASLLPMPQTVSRKVQGQPQSGPSNIVGREDLLTLPLHLSPDSPLQPTWSDLGTPTALLLSFIIPRCTIYFWDIRPTRPPPATPEKKKEEVIEVPKDVPLTFLHLDLSWRPLLKISFNKTGTTLDYCPIKVSLRDDYLHYAPKDPQTLQLKAQLAGPDPFHNLEYGLSLTLRPIEDYDTKFFIGTGDGEVIYSDWKLERDHDSGKLISQKPVFQYRVHDGSIHTVQRSPFYRDIILTIGGWNIAIWKEGVCEGPLLQSCCNTKRYTAGHWSLTRPGVFFLGREDGYIDIWDLLEKTHEACQTQNICITTITYIRPWQVSAKQQFVAIADHYGTLHILEIPWTLSHPSPNEAVSVNNYFEREVNHLKYVEKRWEMRTKEKEEMLLEAERKKIEPPGARQILTSITKSVVVVAIVGLCFIILENPAEQAGRKE